MKKRPFYLFLLAVLLIIAAVVLCAKRAIVPNEAIGQDRTVTDTTNYSWWGPTPEQFLNDVEVDYKSEYIVICLLKIYREYSAACFADSTWCIDKAVSFMPKDYVTTRIERINGTDVHFLHREPTLQGFMDWLEEKYEAVLKKTPPIQNATREEVICNTFALASLTIERASFKDWQIPAINYYMFVLIAPDTAVTIDTFGVITIYDPSISVKWDTLK